jgi:nucleotide-binding universal stress UspA family protein
VGGGDSPVATRIGLARILVPIDFSDLSFKALQYATALAQQVHADLFLLHVVEPAPPLAPEFGPSAALAYDIRPLKRARANDLTAWRKKANSPRPMRTAVRWGSPYWEIVRAARENHCDLIVIGTHGRTGLGRLIIGSTAERVVRLAMCPVLVVREREEDSVRCVGGSGRRRGQKPRRATLQTERRTRSSRFPRRPFSATPLYPITL